MEEAMQAAGEGVVEEVGIGGRPGVASEVVTVVVAREVGGEVKVVLVEVG